MSVRMFPQDMSICTGERGKLPSPTWGGGIIQFVDGLDRTTQQRKLGLALCLTAELGH